MNRLVLFRKKTYIRKYTNFTKTTWKLWNGNSTWRVKVFANYTGVQNSRKLFFFSTDPKSFFDLIYKQLNKTDLSKRKLLEGKQNFKNFTLSNKIDKTIFTSLQVIGQLDSKFIIGFLKCTGYIFIFDQHAVHERIRLESLYKRKLI